MSTHRFDDMVKTPPPSCPITGELEMVIKRLSMLRDSFQSLANDFGVRNDTPRDFAHSDCSRPREAGEGISFLRVLINEINVQIAEIEREHERLWRARTELLGGVSTEPTLGASKRDPLSFPSDPTQGCCRR